MSADLREMHALLQQLQDLNEAHDLDHCEVKWLNAIAEGAARVGNAAVAGVKAGHALVKGGTEGLAKHNTTVADQQKRDTDVSIIWKPMTDEDKRQVLKNAIDKTDPNVVGPLFLGNAATKDHFETCVETYLPPVTVAV